MSKRSSVRVWVCAVLGILFLGMLIVGIDLLLTHGKTARGATVAGLDAGNLTPTQSSEVLDQLAARAAKPVILVTPKGETRIDPKELGLSFDAAATLERLRQQPIDPFRRIGGLLGSETHIDPVITVNRRTLGATLDARRKQLELSAVEGGVRFDQGKPVADMPTAGQRIARGGLPQVLRESWLRGRPITMPTEEFSPTVSAETVRITHDGPATTAMAGPIVLNGRDGAKPSISPAELGEVLEFVADGRGGLSPKLDHKAAVRSFSPALASTVREPVEATFTLSGGRPEVVASKDGARIDWTTTLAAIQKTALTSDQSSQRTVDVVYDVVKPKLSTSKAAGLGVDEVVSEFTTGGFAEASGENIRLVAQAVDGAVVLPGESFSLNGYTGTRGSAQGYVTSTIIDHGHTSKAVGGGISQFATTLYNAAYFAGLEDMDHTEHSYYISRYPEAREATVFDGAIDLVFRNNSDHGIVIDTEWSPSAITVRLWVTKTVEVQSITGSRSLYTDPEKVTLPAGDDCVPSNGSKGFTTSDTRVITDAKTGAEISRRTRTVKYDPEPNVVCQ